jgi:hypothetical protein
MYSYNKIFMTIEVNNYIGNIQFSEYLQKTFLLTHVVLINNYLLQRNQKGVV